MNRIFAVAKSFLGLILIILAVECVVRTLKTPSYIFPRPTDVWLSMRTQTAGVKVAWLTTMGEALAGFALALAVSSCMASAAAFLPGGIARAINNIGIAVQSTPLLAIAPFLSLWFGQSFASKAAAAAIVCFFPLLTGWLTGIRSVEIEQLQLMENLGANRWQKVRFLMLPNALPYFFGGVRVAMPLALLGAIVGEFVGASEGIGFRILSNSYYVRTATMFGYVILAAITGWTLTTLFAAIEQRALFWHGQDRRA